MRTQLHNSRRFQNFVLTAIVGILFFTSNVNAQFGTKVYKNAPAGKNSTLIWSSDETLLTGTTTGQIFQLNLKNGTYSKQQDLSSGSVNDLEYIIGNKLVAAHGNAVKGINNDINLKGHNVVTHVDQNNFANYFASGGQDGKVILWSRDYEEINTLEAHTKPILALTSSPDGRLLASSASDNSVKIWEVSSGALVKTFTSSKNQITALEFTRDGRYLIGGTSSGGVVGWLTDSWERGFVTRALNSTVVSVSVSRDDKYLVCSSTSGTMSLIYLSRESKDKISFGEAYSLVEFNPSGTKLAGLAASGEVHIYDCTGLKVEEEVFPGSGESASLEITEITVVEKNADGIIDASDEPQLLIKLLNKGKGYAVGLNSDIKISPAVAGMSVPSTIALNGVAPGAEETIILPIAVSDDLATSSKSYLTAKFTEKGGAQSNTGKFKINTLSAKDIANKQAADAEAKKQEELEAAFEKAIEEGDKQMDASSWDAAIAGYKKALDLKKGDSGAQKKLDAALKAKAEEEAEKKEAAALAANKKKYDEEIKKADGLVAAKKWDDAIASYKSAQTLFPKEGYPKTKIAEVTKLKEAGKEEAEFLAKLGEGDKLVAAQKWDDAEDVYNAAKKIKKGDSRADEKIAALESAKEQAIAQKAEADFVAKIKEGDKLTAAKKWDDAIDTYRAAGSIKKGDSRIDQSIAKVTKLKEAELAQLAEAERLKKQEEEYKAHIAKADQLKKAKSWDDAIAKYEDALKVKNGDDKALASIAEVKKSQKLEAEAAAALAAKKKAAADAQKARLEAERKRIEEEKLAEKKRIEEEKAALALAEQEAKEKAAQERIAKNREEQRLKAEAEEKKKADELAAKAKAEKLKEQQRVEALAAKEKADQLKEQQKAEALAAKVKSDQLKEEKAKELALQEEASRIATEEKKAKELALIAEKKRLADLDAERAKTAAANAAKKSSSATNSVEAGENSASIEDRIEAAKANAKADAEAQGLSDREIELAVLRAEMQERRGAAKTARDAANNTTASTAKTDDQLKAEKEAIARQELQAEKIRLAEIKRKEREAALADQRKINKELAEEKRDAAAQAQAQKDAAAATQRERVLAEQKRIKAEKEALAQQRIKDTRDRKAKEAQLLANRQKAEQAQKDAAEQERLAKIALANKTAATNTQVKTSTPAVASTATPTSTDAKKAAALALIQKQNAGSKSQAELENKLRLEKQKAKLQETILRIRNEKAGEDLYGLSAFVEEEPLNLAALEVEKDRLAGTLNNVQRMAPIIFTIQVENKGIDDLDKLRIEYVIPDKVLGLTGLRSEVESFSKGDTRTDKIKFYSLNEHPGNKIDIDVNFYTNNAVKPSLTKKFTIKFGEKLSVSN